MSAALRVLITCAFLDTLATIIWVSLGKAIEANPVMGFFMAHSMVTFAVVKMGITLCCGLVLYELRAQKLARLSLFSMAAMMVGVVVYHTVGWLFLT